VGLVQYASASADLSNDQPDCGANEAVLDTPVCEAPTEPSIGSVDVNDMNSIKFTLDPPSTGRRCKVSLREWGGTDVSYLGITKLTEDCSSVIFDARDVGQSTWPDNQMYSIDYYKYTLGKDIETDNPDCIGLGVSQTLTKPGLTSLSATFIRFQRPNPTTLRVRLDGNSFNPFRFGVCEVVMQKYNGVDLVAPISRFGKCYGDFDFSVDASITSASVPNGIDFSYSFYPDGNIFTGSPLVLGSTQRYSVTSSLECSSGITYTEEPIGTYIFERQVPAPSTGKCTLVIGGTVERDWPGCDPIELTYYELGGLLNSSPPGTAVSIGYKYYEDPSSQTSCTSGTILMTPYIYYPFAVLALYKDSISLALGTPNGAYYNGLTFDATVNFYGSNPTAQASVTVASASGVSTFTAVHGSNNIVMVPGQSYLVELVITDPSNGNQVTGKSGRVALLPADPPLFSQSALPPSVILNGTDCVIVSWTTPSDPTGAPIECYEVTQTQTPIAGGSTATMIVRTCAASERLIPWTEICSLQSNALYQYTINAVSKQQAGFTQLPAQTTSTVQFSLNDLSADKAAVYSTTVNPQSNTYTAGSFPTLSIASASDGNGATPTMKLFVGMLVNRGNLDTSTRTVMQYGIITGTVK